MSESDVKCLDSFPVPDLDLWLEVAFWCQVLLLLQTLATPGPLLPAQLSTAIPCFLGSQTCILMCFSITAFYWAVLELGSRLSGTTFPWVVFSPQCLTCEKSKGVGKEAAEELWRGTLPRQRFVWTDWEKSVSIQVPEKASQCTADHASMPDSLA